MAEVFFLNFVQNLRPLLSPSICFVLRRMGIATPVVPRKREANIVKRRYIWKSCRRECLEGGTCEKNQSGAYANLWKMRRFVLMLTLNASSWRWPEHYTPNNSEQAGKPVCERISKYPILPIPVKKNEATWYSHPNEDPPISWSRRTSPEREPLEKWWPNSPQGQPWKWKTMGCPNIFSHSRKWCLLLRNGGQFFI